MRTCSPAASVSGAEAPSFCMSVLYLLSPLTLSKLFSPVSTARQFFGGQERPVERETLHQRYAAARALFGQDGETRETQRLHVRTMVRLDTSNFWASSLARRFVLPQKHRQNAQEPIRLHSLYSFFGKLYHNGRVFTIGKQIFAAGRDFCRVFSAGML